MEVAHNSWHRSRSHGSLNRIRSVLARSRNCVAVSRSGFAIVKLSTAALAAEQKPLLSCSCDEGSCKWITSNRRVGRYHSASCVCMCISLSVRSLSRRIELGIQNEEIKRMPVSLRYSYGNNFLVLLPVKDLWVRSRSIQWNPGESARFLFINTHICAIVELSVRLDSKLLTRETQTMYK